MTRLLEMLISLVIVAVLFVVVGLLLPSSRTLVEQVETNRRQTIVFDTINSFRRFHEWHPMALYDPSAPLERSGPEEGVGATLSFRSDTRAVGNGSWTIVESEPQRRVAIAIEDERQGTHKRTEFTLRPTGRGGRNIEITQTYNVDYGWNLIGRYSGLRCPQRGDSMSLGLAQPACGVGSERGLRRQGSTWPTCAWSSARPRTCWPCAPARSAPPASRTPWKAAWSGSSHHGRQRPGGSGPDAHHHHRTGPETYNFDVVQPVRTKGSAASMEWKWQ